MFFSTHFEHKGKIYRACNAIESISGNVVNITTPHKIEGVEILHYQKRVTDETLEAKDIWRNIFTAVLEFTNNDYRLL